MAEYRLERERIDGRTHRKTGPADGAEVEPREEGRGGNRHNMEIKFV